MSINSTYRSELPLPPSCVAFSPTQPAFFVVGTYYLERSEDQASENVSEEAPKAQSRHGSLILNEVEGETM